MPIGANLKREDEYEEIETKLKNEYRYLGREEVASRPVNK